MANEKDLKEINTDNILKVHFRHTQDNLV